jgi:hypothetical protein
MHSRAFYKSTYQTGLYDNNLLLSQGNNRDDELHSVSETGVQQTTKGFSNIEGQFFGSK